MKAFSPIVSRPEGSETDSRPVQYLKALASREVMPSPIITVLIFVISYTVFETIPVATLPEPDTVRVPVVSSQLAVASAYTVNTPNEPSRSISESRSDKALFAFFIVLPPGKS